MIFWLQLVASVCVFSIIAAWYVGPSLPKHSFHSVLIGLLWVHVPRYLGMTLLVKGMIDPQLPGEFATRAAYGDFLAAAMALVSIFALHRNWRFAIPLVWVANTFGFADLLIGIRGVVSFDVPSFNLQTLWYVYVFYAPLVLVSHTLIFMVLTKPRKSWEKLATDNGR